MTGISITREGRAARLLLQRPEALNALTPEICAAVLDALPAFAEDPDIDLVILEGAGDKAFCAGGDIAQVYAEGTRGNADYARTFWRLEYRMNAAIARFPKPVVSLMQGYTMGGGVGFGCHASHRVVAQDAKIAMPECAIGLVTDVGGTLLLARAPGRLGAYLACTADRMGAADAIYAGFADHLVPRDLWPDLIAELSATGDAGAVAQAAIQTDPGPLAALAPRIDTLFAADSLAEIVAALDASTDDVATQALARLCAHDPLAMAASLDLIRRARHTDRLEDALEQEFRFTSRAVDEADFLEGIRARIIDRDNAPHWTYGLRDVPRTKVADLLAPLPDGGLGL